MSLSLLTIISLKLISMELGVPRPESFSLFFFLSTSLEVRLRRLQRGKHEPSGLHISHKNSKQLGLLSINFDHHLNCVVCG